MSSLVIEIPAISDQTLEVMKRVIDENEKTQKITDAESGPLPLAAALSDFFQLASSVENGNQQLETDVISELAEYALDLLDRLAHQLWQLDIHDQGDNLARIYISLSVWFARRNAVLDNLQGSADGFANLVNRENNMDELANLSQLMDEILEAASDKLKMDEDRSNPWRPWRVLNLNSGVAATRSLNTRLMQATFEKLGRRLPYDMPGFFADGKRQMDAQDVPQEVRDLMTRYAEKWPEKSPH
ncbi:MAG: hypothetical protein PVG66_00560 [Chromatiales bacterium]|jgi:hypothetical protein